MRLSPTTVQRWFAAATVPKDTLASYIVILPKDPNWGLVDIGGESERTFRLLYFPASVPFDVVLDRTAVTRDSYWAHN